MLLRTMGCRRGVARFFCTAVAAPTNAGRSRRRITSFKAFQSIFRTTRRNLEPFLFRSDRQSEREEIMRHYMQQWSESLYQFRAILDPASLGLSCQHLGQLTPLLRSYNPGSWFIPRIAPLMPLLTEEIDKHLNTAEALHLIQIFWGLSRLGPSLFDASSWELTKRIEDALLETNAFNGNNASAMVEALSNLNISPPQSALDYILRDASYDFSLPSTSPFNLVYFLRAVGKSRYGVGEDVVQAAMYNIRGHMDRLYLHHLAMMVSTWESVPFMDVYDLLHIISEKLSLGACASRGIYVEDAMYLRQFLHRLQIEQRAIQPVLNRFEAVFDSVKSV